MIIFWDSGTGQADLPNPYIYIGLGAIYLSMSSPQALFVYTERSHQITMELNEQLVTLEI